MNIRPEQAGDADPIKALTALAFAPKAFSDGTEPLIPGRLRSSGDLLLSLVAEDRLADAPDGLIGHIAFSPVSVGELPGWVCLGPLSVHPDHQRQGVGTALVQHGLREMQKRGHAGCVLMGDPGYYGRFGFAASDALTYKADRSRHLQAVAFAQAKPVGDVVFHRAFGDD